MSLPPVIPEQSAAGIAVDPATSGRIVPQSRRPDGSVRKEIRIRPGFTPQEDVSRFRSTRQQQIERNTLPKGHILGWIAPSSETNKTDEGDKSKSQKKNEKRKAKREQKKQEIIKASWEDEDEDEDDDAIPTAKESKNAKTSPITPVHGKAPDSILELNTEMGNMEIH